MAMYTIGTLVEAEGHFTLLKVTSVPMLLTNVVSISWLWRTSWPPMQ